MINCRVSHLISLTTVIIFHFCTSYANSVESRCFLSKIRSISYSPTKLSSQLAEVPALRDMVIAMMADAGIPISIKRIIKISLEDENTTVKHLTDSIREEYGIPKNFNAAHIAKGSAINYSLVPPDSFLLDSNGKNHVQGSSDKEAPKSSQTLNEAASEANMNATGMLTAPHTVFVQNRAINSEENDLISLIHELSHVRFDAYFQKNLPLLSTKFPKTLIKEVPGTGHYFINQHFHDFLAERYAHQTEWDVLKSTHGKYFKDFYSKFGKVRDWDSKEVNQAISIYVIHAYQISDPAVLVLAERTLSNILLEGVR